MKKQTVIFACLFAIVMPVSAVWAEAGHHDHGMQEAKDSAGHHKKNAGHEHGNEISAAGQAGSPDKVSRTIKITAFDTMQYDKKDIQARPGETIRFVVTNAGKIKHEFTIGTREEQLEHAEMMASMPGMEHEEGNSVSLEAGESKELVWQFGKAGAVEIACHLPGHFEAGMKAKVSIKK
ncbi:MAG TPA: cupredoxin family protein [Gallionellaceae bacterium]|nr:cupredoxin family protein [Gallionellaceae bacterium]